MRWSGGVVLVSMGMGACGGGDPLDAPGCPPFERRCDGQVLQLCQIDAARRVWVWFDITDCVHEGMDIGEDLVCVEEETDAGVKAACVELDPDGGGPRGDD